MEVLWYVLGIIQKLLLELSQSQFLSPHKAMYATSICLFHVSGFNLQICERSLTPTTGGPPATSSVRATMLPSGYLIRPFEGGGSIIHIVDHIDLDVSKCNWSIKEHCFYLHSFFWTNILLTGLQCSRSPQATLWIVQDPCSENDNGGKKFLKFLSRQWAILRSQLTIRFLCRPSDT